MAIITFFAQPAFMGLVFAMAVDTATGGVPVFFPCFVAADTGHVRMRTRSAEVRTPMIKCFLAEQDNVGVPPLVFGMTGTATGRRNIFYTSMETFFLRDIPADVLVTITTEFLLLVLVERFMALAA